MTTLEFDAFQKEADTWEAESQRRAERSEKRAWAVALAAILFAALEGVALVGLTPLKRVELRLIEVEKNTGVSNIVTEVKGDPLQYIDVRDKAWVSRYVTNRERYSNELTGTDYDDIALWSAGDVAAQYRNFIDPAKPKSPLNVYGKSGKVLIHIVSVSIREPGLALVRYTRTERLPSGAETAPVNWLATVAYKYTDMDLTEEERRVNPDQFQVTDYVTSIESLQSNGR